MISGSGPLAQRRCAGRGHRESEGDAELPHCRDLDRFHTRLGGSGFYRRRNRTGSIRRDKHPLNASGAQCPHYLPSAGNTPASPDHLPDIRHSAAPRSKQNITIAYSSIAIRRLSSYFPPVPPPRAPKAHWNLPSRPCRSRSFPASCADWQYRDRWNRHG